MIRAENDTPNFQYIKAEKQWPNENDVNEQMDLITSNSQRDS